MLRCSIQFTKQYFHLSGPYQFAFQPFLRALINSADRCTVVIDQEAKVGIACVDQDKNWHFISISACVTDGLLSLFCLHYSHKVEGRAKIRLLLPALQALAYSLLDTARESLKCALRDICHRCPGTHGPHIICCRLTALFFKKLSYVPTPF